MVIGMTKNGSLAMSFLAAALCCTVGFSAGMRLSPWLVTLARSPLKPHRAALLDGAHERDFAGFWLDLALDYSEKSREIRRGGARYLFPNQKRLAAFDRIFWQQRLSAANGRIFVRCTGASPPHRLANGSVSIEFGLTAYSADEDYEIPLKPLRLTVIEKSDGFRIADFAIPDDSDGHETALALLKASAANLHRSAVHQADPEVSWQFVVWWLEQALDYGSSDKAKDHRRIAKSWLALENSPYVWTDVFWNDGLLEEDGNRFEAHCTNCSIVRKNTNGSVLVTATVTFFKVGTPEVLKILNLNVTVLKHTPGYRIGHTEIIGDADGSTTLSELSELRSSRSSKTNPS